MGDKKKEDWLKRSIAESNATIEFEQTNIELCLEALMALVNGREHWYLSEIEEYLDE